MEFMYQVEDKLLDELKEISQKLGNGEDMTSQCLDDIKDISISLYKLTAYQAMKEGGYSHDSGMGGYSNNSGYSYANRGQRRDSMGRFSRGGYPMSRGRMMDDWDREYYPMY